MNVEDGLTRGFAVVGHGAVAIGVEMQVAGDLSETNKSHSDRRGVGFGKVVKTGDVFARNDDDVCRRLRIDVVKSDDVGVFVDFLCGNLAIRDAAKKAAIISSHAAIIR